MLPCSCDSRAEGSTLDMRNGFVDGASLSPSKAPAISRNVRSWDECVGLWRSCFYRVSSPELFAPCSWAVLRRCRLLDYVASGGNARSQIRSSWMYGGRNDNGAGFLRVRRSPYQFLVYQFSQVN